MSNRTVVTVEPHGVNSVQVKLSKAPGAIPGARIPEVFDCDIDQMPPWSQNGALRTHGQAIFTSLDCHSAIKQALSNLLQIRHPDRRSLYFHLVVDEAERLSWEALCDPAGNFLALDKRWPIARMADSEVDQKLLRAEFAPPLRVMGLLSAVKFSATLEWNHLRDAAAAARQRGFDVELLVMVGEEPLLTLIREETAAQNLTWARAEAIPDRVSALDRVLSGYSPHILHCFCHGSAGFGAPQLELGTIVDWDQDLSHGSLIVKLDELLGFPALRNVWLVTLNCCEGGKAANDLHSMAHSLVAGGVPAAIGMTEPINASDAHEFASEFYPALLDHLRTTLAGASPGQSVEFDWAYALHSPRTALRDQHGDPVANRQWTLPVLYVRPEMFDLKYVGVPAGVPPPLVPPTTPPVLTDMQRARIEMVAGALRTLPPDAPIAARQELLAILNDVRPELRPDPNGTLPQGG